MAPTQRDNNFSNSNANPSPDNRGLVFHNPSTNNSINNTQPPNNINYPINPPITTRINPGNEPITPSGVEDIILGIPPKHTPKKRLAIGFAILFTIALIIIIAVIVATNTPHELTMREKFNRLINYVTSGEDSVKNITEKYDRDQKYYYEVQRETKESDALYEKTIELMDEFLITYENSQNKQQFSSNPDYFFLIMSNVKEILDYSRIVKAKTVPDIYYVVDAYATNKEESVRKTFEHYYDFSSINDNIYVNGFTTSFNNYIDKLTKIASIYYANGCVSGNTIQANCIQNTNNSTLITDYTNLLKSLKNAGMILDSHLNIDKSFLIRLYDANEMVNGNDYALK